MEKPDSFLESGGKLIVMSGSGFKAYDIQSGKLIYTIYEKNSKITSVTTGENKLGFKGRKTTTYRNVIVNSDSVTNELSKSKPSEDVVLMPGTQELPDSFWIKNRFEPLSKNEQNIYTLLDTIQKNKTFIF